MAIVDAGPYQDWIRAFDQHERAERRHEAAWGIGNQALIAYLRLELDTAAKELNAATRTLNDQSR